MKIDKGLTTLLFTLILSLLVTACSGKSENTDQQIAVIVALTQTAMAIDNPLAPAATEAVPTLAATGDFQPISEQECSDLNEILSQQTGIAGTITSPEPFDDFPNKKTGFGCKISLTTNGTDVNHDQLGSLAPAALETNGWVEDNMYTFPGIGGLVSAYRKGDQFCLTMSYVEPSDESLCQANEGFLACLDRLSPEQIRYGYDLNCAQPVQ